MAFSIDDFKERELTEAINLVPYKPGMISQMGLFSSENVYRTSVDIEYKKGSLSLITTQPRGSNRGDKIVEDKRFIKTFKIPHIPQFGRITPDQIPDVRRMGTKDGRMAMNDFRRSKMIQFRNNLEVTLEYHRIGALGGIILEPDGSTEVNNLFSIFGISQPTDTINFSSDTVKDKVTAWERAIEKKLGTDSVNLTILCGDNFFDWLTGKAEVKDAYDRWQDGSFLRDGSPRKGFPYAGAWWVNYRGQIGDNTFVATNKARVVPTGVNGLFIERNGPADTAGAVGNLGKEFVVTTEKLPHDTGVELKYQANKLIICTNPSVLYEITGSAS